MAVPGRARVRAARAIYRALVRSPLAPLTRSGFVHRLRDAWIVMRPADVLGVLATLRAADVDVWLTGGWGVDALIGRQTRRHNDVDLVLSDDDEARAREALATIGYKVQEDRASAGAWMPVLVVLRDRAGRVVDLLPCQVRRGERPKPAAGAGTGTHAPYVFTADAFTVGTVEGQPAPCLTAAVQLVLHSGYDLQDADRHDVAALRRRLGLAVTAE